MPFAGNVTLPELRRKLREAAALVPDELLLVETDSPFLSPPAGPGETELARPVPRRRRSRTSVVFSAALDTVVVTANAQRLFGW